MQIFEMLQSIFFPICYSTVLISLPTMSREKRMELHNCPDKKHDTDTLNPKNRTFFSCRLYPLTAVTISIAAAALASPNLSTGRKKECRQRGGGRL